MQDYQSFLEKKRIVEYNKGIEPGPVHPMLFPHQRDMTLWALRRGRACIFADCGLGKTFCEIEFARQIPGDTLILAPLAVAKQTIQEAKKIDVEVHYCRKQEDVKPGINITNYEMLNHFEASHFLGIILDESAIIANFEGKFRNYILDAFANTPYKLACSATPAPNDFVELGNHSQFLGVMSRSEMLSMFFVRDGGETQKWRLKGHAVGEFWKWVASWAVMLKKPSDLGYDDAGFILPPLSIKQEKVTTKGIWELPNGQMTLLPIEAKTLRERISARASSTQERTERCAEIVKQAEDEPFICWCHLNKEADALVKLIPGSVEIRGNDSREKKEAAIEWFKGEICDCQLKALSNKKWKGGDLECICGGIKNKRVLISKQSIFGHGLNLQCCRNVAFVGLSDSWQGYYQAVRRCWRFGQDKEVNVWIITADTEGQVLANIQRKERDAERMAAEMVQHMHLINEGNIKGLKRDVLEYTSRHAMMIPSWLQPQSIS